jgi:hypothetical protein
LCTELRGGRRKEEEESEEQSENNNNTLIRDNDNITIENSDQNTVEEDKEDEQEKEKECERNNNDSTEREGNNNIHTNKTTRNTTGRKETTRNMKEHNDRTQERNLEKASKTKWKEMKVTQENTPFGHVCDDIAVDNNTPYVRVYCQNVSGIFDRDGIGLDSAFKEIKQAGADIFTFNETHGDESNATARRALRLPKQRMWKNNNADCKIVHLSSTAPVLTFAKPEGKMVGITGALVGRVRDTITDPYGRWCGYTLIGRDTKEIMIITACNVSQYKNAKVGEDTLFNQQIALYKLKNIREPDPKKIFIDDLTALVKKARREDKDIILTGDFNELVEDDPRGMYTTVLSAGNLTDEHRHQHGV